MLFNIAAALLPAWFISISKQIVDQIQQEIAKGAAINAMLLPLLFMAAITAVGNLQFNPEVYRQCGRKKIPRRFPEADGIVYEKDSDPLF